MPVGDAVFPLGLEVALEVTARWRATRSQGRLIHSPPTSSPPTLRGHLVKPVVDAVRLQRRTASSGPTSAQAGRPSQRPTQGARRGRLEPAGEPSGHWHDHGPASQPVAVVETVCGSRGV